MQPPESKGRKQKDKNYFQGMITYAKFATGMGKVNK